MKIRPAISLFCLVGVFACGNPRMSAGELIEIAPGEFIHCGFFTDAERHDPIGAARIIDRPWLIVHGEADPVVPIEDALLLSQAAPAAQLVIHPTAGHRFDQPEEREWLVETVAMTFPCWLETNR